MKNLILGLTLIASAFAGPASATDKPVAQERGGSSGVGGGGYFITLPDQSVILGDPFIVRDGVPFKLNPELEKELIAIGKLLVRYGAMTIQTLNSSGGVIEDNGRSLFIDRYVLNGIIDYRYVNDPIPNCTTGRLGSHPGLAEVGGCTTGNKTLIWGPKFLTMTLPEQAKTIIHERLHASPFGDDDEYIADITDGIEVALKLYAAQTKGNGTKVYPTKEQFNKLATMKMRIVQIGLRGDIYSPENQKWVQDYNVTPNGGGLLGPNDNVADDAFIGIGALVTRSSLESGSTIIGTECHVCTFGKDSKIVNSATDSGLRVGQGGQVINSKVPNGKMGINTSIKDSEVRYGPFDMADGSHALKSQFRTLYLGADSSVTNSDLKYVGVQTSSNSILNNVVIAKADDSSIIMGTLSKLENWNINLDKFSGRFKINPGSVVKNLKGTMLLDYSFWSEPSLKFENQVPIDGENIPVCPNGKMVFKGGNSIGSLKDLKKSCK